MDFINKLLESNSDGFDSDPFGYSSLAWHKWGMAQTVAGFPVDITQPPSSKDLKSPVLWLSQAHALSQAAVNLLMNEPDLSAMPKPIQSVCHSQYYAVGLMLVGYSLESCLKSMLIMQKGIDEYTSDEKKYKHHRLEELAEFMPDLTLKEKAILKALTHFVYWAGRYPDPGSGRDSDAEDIFSISEQHKISANDLFKLTSKIMTHSRVVSGEYRS
jgi:hypothetical protein